VLIVDDDEDSREWVRRVLVGAGADAIDVADVGSALRAVEEFSPHVLVSDLAMPNRDGFDLVRFLRARGYSASGLPAIALSAFADHEHKDRALGASFQTFISKPPDPRELLDAVAALGNAARAGHALSRDQVAGSGG
jgi:CheY-like chemotaxis protein